MKEIYFQQFKNFNQEQWHSVIKVARIVNTVKDLIIDKLDFITEDERNVVIDLQRELVVVYGDNEYDKKRTTPVKLRKIINQNDCFDGKNNIAFKVRDRAFGHVGNLILHAVARLFPDVIKLEETYEELTCDELVFIETVLLSVKGQTLSGTVLKYPVTGPGNALKVSRDGKVRVEFNTVYEAIDAVNKNLTGMGLNVDVDTVNVHLIKSEEKTSPMILKCIIVNGKVETISEVKL